ncbi:hypothetical protein QJQ45_003995 [Haematococcus lacustris]|nr:hypothetical protein QJQ45_003995 [Haematococcus lacustris]
MQEGGGLARGGSAGGGGLTSPQLDLTLPPSERPANSMTKAAGEEGRGYRHMQACCSVTADPTEPNEGKGEAKGEPTQPTKAAKAKPAPQPGKWLDRACNAALNMQRIGESRWHPLELCYWPDQGALPAKGKEYPGLGYERLRDKPPKAQQQQQQPAEAQ